MTNPKKRILHLIATSGYTGAERYLEGWLSALNNSGEYDFSLVCPPGSLPKRAAPYVSEVIELDICKLGSYKSSKILKKLIKEKNFEYVHVHGPRAHYIGYRATRYLKNVKLIATVYELLTHRCDMSNLKQFFYSKIERRILRNTPYLSPISNFVQKEIQNLGIRKEGLTNVYFGMKFDESMNPANLDAAKKIDLSDLKEKFIKDHSLPKNQKFVGMIGRLMPHKGHECFLKAIPGLVGNLSEVTALILGDGPLHDDLLAKAKNLGIMRNIHFIKQVENSLDFIKILDLFVLPSLYESFGIVILEAMSQGKPIVATNVGGIPELIENNKTGFLIKPGDCGALSARSIQLLTNPIFSQRISISAYEYAKNNFSEENFKKQILDFYDKIFKGVEVQNQNAPE